MILNEELTLNNEKPHSRIIVSVLGIPMDVISLEDSKNRILISSSDKERLVLSTPNLHFILHARKDSAFKSYLIKSDIVIPDGMGLIWLSKIIGTRDLIKVSGSNLFENLFNSVCNPKLKVFLFGGQELVAQRAALRINKDSDGVSCVGYIYPGFGTVEELSSEHFIKSINESNSDFLLVSLGAEKGQSWIFHNLHKLNTPVISHLGAVINFTAGHISRAPVLVQTLGLEWLWRIKEEPYLFSRYFRDGLTFIHLIFRTLIPYRFHKWIGKRRSEPRLEIEISHQTKDMEIHVFGSLIKSNIEYQISVFNSLPSNLGSIKLFLDRTTYIDEYGFGQILILHKRYGQKLMLEKVSKWVSKALAYEGINIRMNTKHEKQS